jgi:propanol-preferring alcohol dehydrogenase
MGLHVAALDVSEDKLALARSLGAEITVSAKLPDAAQQVIKQTGGGAHGVLVTAVVNAGSKMHRLAGVKMHQAR